MSLLLDRPNHWLVKDSIPLPYQFRFRISRTGAKVLRTFALSVLLVRHSFIYLLLRTNHVDCVVVLVTTICTSCEDSEMNPPRHSDRFVMQIEESSTPPVEEANLKHAKMASNDLKDSILIL